MRAADGRGRRQGAHAVPDRGPRRRAAAGGRAVLRRRLPGAAVRAATAASPGTRTGGRRSSRCARSATWCCCATPSRRGSRRRHRGVRPCGRRNGASKTDANAARTRSSAAAPGERATREPGAVAGHDHLVDDDDDRPVGQVQAVRRRPRLRSGRASSTRRSGAGRPVASPISRHAIAGPEREVDPEQVVERPHRALPPDRREHGRCGGEREPGPRPRPGLLAATRPAARMPIANSAARSGGDWITKVSRGACGPTIPTAATTSVTAATMSDGAPAADHQEQQREQDVQLGLDGHRPERPVRARRADDVLHQQAVDDDRLRAGRSLPRRRRRPATPPRG